MKFLEPFSITVGLSVNELFRELKGTIGYSKHLEEEKLQPYFDRAIQHKIEVYWAGLEITKNRFYSKTFLSNLITHDFSKFSEDEAWGYANHDFKSKEPDGQFEAAWHHHKMTNPHHPEYWLNPGRDGKCEPIPMPEIYVWEMVADWIGAGRTYGSTLEAWLPDNLPKFLFHELTTLKLQEILGKIGIETLVADGRVYVN